MAPGPAAGEVARWQPVAAPPFSAAGLPRSMDRTASHAFERRPAADPSTARRFQIPSDWPPIRPIWLERQHRSQAVAIQWTDLSHLVAEPDCLCRHMLVFRLRPGLAIRRRYRMLSLHCWAQHHPAPARQLSGHHSSMPRIWVRPEFSAPHCTRSARLQPATRRRGTKRQSTCVPQNGALENFLEKRT
jgi:hypothetical protein